MNSCEILCSLCLCRGHVQITCRICGYLSLHLPRQILVPRSKYFKSPFFTEKGFFPRICKIFCNLLPIAVNVVCRYALQAHIIQFSATCSVKSYPIPTFTVDRQKVRLIFLASQIRQTQLHSVNTHIGECLLSGKTCHSNCLVFQTNGLKVYQPLP